MNGPIANHHVPPVVLLADDDEQLLDALRRRCEHAGLHVELAHDGLSALAAIDRCEPDLIVLDVSMPGGSGLELCRTLAAGDSTRHIPVVILTGRQDEHTVRQCHDLLAYYVPKCTDVWGRIAPLVSELLAVPVPASATACEPAAPDLAEPMAPDVDSGLDQPDVLCIDDDIDFGVSLKLRLAERGLNVCQANTGMQGYRMAFLQQPKAIVLDYEMQDGKGDYVLRRLKENPHTRDIPVIVLTGRPGNALQRRMDAMGAASFFGKPAAWDVLWPELKRQLGRAEAQRKETADATRTAADSVG